MPFLTLPNGMHIRHISRMGETQFIYREIFEERCYLQHGIVLPEEPVVLDVGANIGLFTMYVARHHPGARIFAFEPTPPIAAVLRDNVKSHPGQAEIRVFEHGLSDRVADAHVTYFPNLPGSSTTRPDEKESVKAFMKGELMGNLRAHSPAAFWLTLPLFPFRRSLVPWMVERLYRPVRHLARFLPLSHVLTEHNVAHVDLLKIDVEGAELDVLRGVGAAHWPRIRQVAMELHDVDGRLQAARALLESEGFRVQHMTDPLNERVQTYNVYATRQAG